MNGSARRALLVSSGWMQAVVIVVLCGFLILGILAYRTYTDEPPIPSQVVDPSGQLIFSGGDVIAGQEVFLRNGLMEYGSIFGHGAYLGPDFTADYLHRAALIVIDHYGGSSSEAAKQQTITDFKTNRYDGSTGVLKYSGAQAEAFEKLDAYYAGFFGTPDTQVWTAALGHHRPPANQTTDSLLQLVGLGWCGAAPESRLFLHQQLAPGAAGRESSDSRRNRLERTLADSPARWHWAPPRGVWPLEFVGMARSRGPTRLVPSS